MIVATTSGLPKSDLGKMSNLCQIQNGEIHKEIISIFNLLAILWHSNVMSILIRIIVHNHIVVSYYS